MTCRHLHHCHKSALLLLKLLMQRHLVSRMRNAYAICRKKDTRPVVFAARVRFFYFEIPFICFQRATPGDGNKTLQTYFRLWPRVTLKPYCFYKKEEVSWYFSGKVCYDRVKTVT